MSLAGLIESVRKDITESAASRDSDNVLSTGLLPASGTGPSHTPQHLTVVDSVLEDYGGNDLKRIYSSS